MNKNKETFFEAQMDDDRIIELYWKRNEHAAKNRFHYRPDSKKRLFYYF